MDYCAIRMLTLPDGRSAHPPFGPTEIAHATACGTIDDDDDAVAELRQELFGPWENGRHLDPTFFQIGGLALVDARDQMCVDGEVATVNHVFQYAVQGRELRQLSWVAEYGEDVWVDLEGRMAEWFETCVVYRDGAVVDRASAATPGVYVVDPRTLG